MKKKIMTLMMGTLLLLTACGQTGGSSASAMLPVAAVQSAAQAIAPVEDKAQGDVESLPAEETVEETQDAGGGENPKPAEGAETPSGKTEETPSAPISDGQPAVPEQPTTPEQPVIPAPQPEPAPSEPEPAPTPKPAASGNIYSIAEAIQAGNEYARAQYGVVTDSGLTLGNSAYRFPASVAADASQETLEAKARDMVDYTFRQLMMQAGVDTLADAGIRCSVCIVEDGASLLIYVLYAG